MQNNPNKSTLKLCGAKRLKLKYDEPLSNFAFKSHLRRYIMADELVVDVKLAVAQHALRLAAAPKRTEEVIEMGDGGAGGGAGGGGGGGGGGRGLRSFTLELNLSNSGTHAWVELGYTVERRA